MTTPDPAVVSHAIRELRTATECTCDHPSPLRRRHDRHCNHLFREDVDTLATELERLRRVDELARALVEHFGSVVYADYLIADGADLLAALADEVAR